MSAVPKVVVIAGPTAGGKTRLSVELALRLGGEIVNADSMQVYRGMDVGTAKPSIEERKGVPHHLLDLVNPDEEFNAAMYRARALPVIRDIRARGRACLVVGGTGLYLKALMGGLFDVPPSDGELRAFLRRACRTHGVQVLHEKLRLLDSGSAERIHPHDEVRIVRALEILFMTGRRPSELSREHAFGDRPLDVLKLCLDVNREYLYGRIDRRATQMMEGGLVPEVEALLAKGYSPELKSMKSIGYRHVVNYLRGHWTLEEAFHFLKRDTRRYAKRQLTWFRGDSEFVWISPEDPAAATRMIEGFLDGQY